MLYHISYLALVFKQVWLSHIKMEIPKKCSPWTYIFKIIRTRILWLFHGRETETHTAALSILFTFKRLMRIKIENIIYWENWYLDISNTINTKIFLKSSTLYHLWYMSQISHFGLMLFNYKYEISWTLYSLQKVGKIVQIWCHQKKHLDKI